jgi:hypothetical protein
MSNVDRLFLGCMLGILVTITMQLSKIIELLK